MPILRRDGKRIFFAHIPKSAGSSLYHALLVKDYQMANFGSLKGDLGQGADAPVSRHIREVYKISALQKEGDLSKVKTSLQHVTADIWSTWGPFDYSFAVFRDPMARFRSAYLYNYKYRLLAAKIAHNPARFQQFEAGMAPFFENEFPKKQNAFNNHFRRPLDFVLPQTKLYFLEHGGLVDLARDLGLDPLPHQNKNEVGSDIEIGDRAKRFAHEYCAEDIKFYEDTCLKQGGQASIPT